MPRSSATQHELGQLSVIEPGYPPPPYQSHPSLECGSDVSSTTATNNNHNAANNNHHANSAVSIVASRNKPVKPFWRKLSQ